MNSIVEKTRLSFDEFLQHPDRDGSELIDGELTEKHVSVLSSLVATRLAARLQEFCDRTGAGFAFGSDLVYRCFADEPDAGRRPDVSFVRRERLPDDWRDLGYFRLAPDLSVEVVSSNDLAYEVDAKTDQYLRAGVRLVWIVNPIERLVHVHRADGSVAKIRESDALDGEDVLPGFSFPVADLFPASA